MRPEAPRAGGWGAAAVASQPPRAQDLRRAGGVGTARRGGTVGLARGEACSETKAEPRARVPESQDHQVCVPGVPLCVQRRAEDGTGAGGCQREVGPCRAEGWHLALRCEN